MAEKRKINSKEDLLRELGISSLEELGSNEKAQERFKELIPQLPLELLKQVVTVVPKALEALRAIVGSMQDIGKSLEETKRLRWQGVVELAKAGVLTGDQALEAMTLLREIERNESIDWTTILKGVVGVLGAIATVALLILRSSLPGGRRST